MQNNFIEKHSTHNEGKSVVAEKSIRTSKKKNINTWPQYKKILYIDKLDNIVNQYHNTYHRTIKNEN